MGPPRRFVADRAALRTRTVYSAAHVVADPTADNAPDAPVQLDWDATLGFRRRLWAHGLGVAEAMDTAQRGMGLDWAATQELIRRSAAEAEPGDLLACGVGADQLQPGSASLADVEGAYEEQLAVAEACDAVPILMCSRELAALAQGPDDYLQIYSQLLRQARRPVILHWLGEMFDPQLAGYWGGADVAAAMDTVIELIRQFPRHVDGVKISLLDADLEIEFRRRLPEGVRCYTGDDFNYPQLIAGDAHGHSDALLGIFDPLAPYAAAAVRALDAGEPEQFRAILDPTTPLARKVFEAPTRFYKTGVVFLAWLAGCQDRFRMVAGMETARSLSHLIEVFVLADAVGFFDDPDAAAFKMRGLIDEAS